MPHTRMAAKREHDEAGVAIVMIKKLPKPVEHPEYTAARQLLRLRDGVW